MIIHCSKCGKFFDSWDGFCMYCAGSEEQAQIINAKIAIMYKGLRELARLLDIPFEKSLDKLELTEVQRKDLLYLHDHQTKIDICLNKMRAIPQDKKS